MTLYELVREAWLFATSMVGSFVVGRWIGRRAYDLFCKEEDRVEEPGKEAPGDPAGPGRGP